MKQPNYLAVTGMKFRLIQLDVTKIYIGYFGYTPDPEGLDYWVGQATNSGDGTGGVASMSLSAIAASISMQAEAIAHYPCLTGYPVLNIMLNEDDATIGATLDAIVALSTNAVYLINIIGLGNGWGSEADISADLEQRIQS